MLKGRIKFSNANMWVKYAENKELEGRGDLLEGVFAATSITNINAIRQLFNRYNDVIPYPCQKTNLVYYRRKSIMQLPAYCYYMPKITDYEEVYENRIIKYKQTIPPNFFQDFADNVSSEEAKTLPLEEQPCLVIIDNPEEFRKRIKQTLVSKRISAKDIIEEAISYTCMSSPFDFTNTFPSEYVLTQKSVEFSNQSEGRIIIKTKDKSVIDELLANSIAIGDISDIAQIADNYMYHGASLEYIPEVEES